jgi:DNA-binding HxlR family transcriptional regulator
MYAVMDTSVSLLGGSEARDLRRLPRNERDLIEQIEQALALLHGKWKVYLVFLMARGVHRHCRLLDCLPGASKKMMTDTLRALERDGLVRRQIFAEVPLRVEYSLTPLGWAITEPLMGLAEWHKTHGDEVREARLRYHSGSGDLAEPPLSARPADAVRGTARRLEPVGSR